LKRGYLILERTRHILGMPFLLIEGGYQAPWSPRTYVGTKTFPWKNFIPPDGLTIDGPMAFAPGFYPIGGGYQAPWLQQGRQGSMKSILDQFFSRSSNFGFLKYRLMAKLANRFSWSILGKYRNWWRRIYQGISRKTFFCRKFQGSGNFGRNSHFEGTAWRVWFWEIWNEPCPTPSDIVQPPQTYSFIFRRKQRPGFGKNHNRFVLG